MARPRRGSRATTRVTRRPRTGPAHALLAAMQIHSKPVKPPALGIIGKEHFRQRFEAAGCEMESFDYH